MINSGKMQDACDSPPVGVSPNHTSTNLSSRLSLRRNRFKRGQPVSSEDSPASPSTPGGRGESPDAPIGSTTPSSSESDPLGKISEAVATRTRTASVHSGQSRSADSFFSSIRLILEEFKDDLGTRTVDDAIVSEIAISMNQAIRQMSPIGVLVMDRHSIIRDANPKCTELFGLDKEELVGQNVNILMPAEVAGQHTKFVDSYLSRYESQGKPPSSNLVGASSPAEFVAVRVVGQHTETFPIQLRVRGIHHPRGRHLPYIFFVAYVEDVQAKHELSKTMEVNNYIKEKGDFALIVMDYYGKVLDFNPKAAQIFRYDRHFVLGQNIKKLMPPELAVRHDDVLRRFRERWMRGFRTSNVIGHTLQLPGWRPKYDSDGCERFRLELRVEALQDNKTLVAFIRDLEASLSQSEFMEKTTRDIFPAHTVERLMKGEPVWDSMDNVTVLFSDVKDFTSMSADMSPEAIFSFINAMVSAFDECGIGMEKIKTIGDGYMAYFHSADEAVITALRMLEWGSQHNTVLRVGLHTGSIVAGVVGKSKRGFDMWGDTVNTAKRMEETSRDDQIQLSEETFDAIEEDVIREMFHATTAQVKGKGPRTTYITDFAVGELSVEALNILNDTELQHRKRRGSAKQTRFTD